MPIPIFMYRRPNIAVQRHSVPGLLATTLSRDCCPPRPPRLQPHFCPWPEGHESQALVCSLQGTTLALVSW